MYEIVPVKKEWAPKIADYFADNWGGSVIVTKGRVHYAENLEGFAIVVENEIKSIIEYFVENEECEIVLLESTIENQGIGTRLIEKVVEKARERKCKRVWLITTNDNSKAIRFYQRRGFNMAGLYLNAIEESRKLKPGIPMFGCDGIPISHEIEFELKL